MTLKERLTLLCWIAALIAVLVVIAIFARTGKTISSRLIEVEIVGVQAMRFDDSAKKTPPSLTIRTNKGMVAIIEVPDASIYSIGQNIEIIEEVTENGRNRYKLHN